RQGFTAEIAERGTTIPFRCSNNVTRRNRLIPAEEMAGSLSSADDRYIGDRGHEPDDQHSPDGVAGCNCDNREAERGCEGPQHEEYPQRPFGSDGHIPQEEERHKLQVGADSGQRMRCPHSVRIQYLDQNDRHPDCYEADQWWLAQAITVHERAYQDSGSDGI